MSETSRPGYDRAPFGTRLRDYRLGRLAGTGTAATDRRSAVAWLFGAVVCSVITAVLDVIWP